MTGETDWTPQRIREAYGQSLKHYNVLFTPQPARIKEEKEILDAFNTDGDDFYKKAFFKKLKEISPVLKAAADRSGNAQIWRAGETLDNLSQGMRERIERALKFGL